MKLTLAKRVTDRAAADMLVIPFWEGSREALSGTRDTFPFALTPALKIDFKGSQGQQVVLYQDTGKESRVVLLGLGKESEATRESLRTAYSGVTLLCRDKKLKSLNVLLPVVSHLAEEQVETSVVEGLYLANYAFDLHKTKSRALLSTICVVGGSSAAKEAAAISQAVHFARDLVNGNADDVTPEFLGVVANGLAEQYPELKATVFDKARIAQEGMGLLLAVNQGSDIEPRFIILEYRGNPKKTDHTVLVGKGVTFDTGGLDIKPASSMEHQRTDMGGAGAVLGAMKAIAELGLKVNVTAVIPSTDNSIGSRSYKPGDVYRAYNGATVEIGNTDAEGRLILADALAYAVKNLKPTRIIDLATLTGAIIVALGDEVAGMMSTDDQLAEALSLAGEYTYERVWRLPLIEEYRSALKSDRADYRNVGSGSGGGSIAAAHFLQAFVGDLSWAHLDIAGTRYLSEAKRYRLKGATGYGVRLLVEYFKRHQ